MKQTPVLSLSLSLVCAPCLPFRSRTLQLERKKKKGLRVSLCVYETRYDVNNLFFFFLLLLWHTFFPSSSFTSCALRFKNGNSQVHMPACDREEGQMNHDKDARERSMCASRGEMLLPPDLQLIDVDGTAAIPIDLLENLVALRRIREPEPPHELPELKLVQLPVPVIID